MSYYRERERPRDDVYNARPPKTFFSKKESGHRRGDPGASRKHRHRYSPVVVNRGYYSSDEEDVIILPPPPASALPGGPLAEEFRRSDLVPPSARRRMPAPEITVKRHEVAGGKYYSSDEEARSEPVKIVEETIAVPRREETTYYYDPEKKETTKVSHGAAVDTYTEYVPVPTRTEQYEENVAQLKKAREQEAKEAVERYKFEEIHRKERRVDSEVEKPDRGGQTEHYVRYRQRRDGRGRSPSPLLMYRSGARDRLQHRAPSGSGSDTDEGESGEDHAGSEAEEADPTFDAEMTAYDDFGFGGVESEVSSQFESFEQPASIAEGKASWDADFVNVYSSLYTGDGEFHGHHTATLNVIHGLTGPGRPLFRWLHIKQAVMDFDDFWTQIRQQITLLEWEKELLQQLQGKVKSKDVKSRRTATGKDIAYAEPHTASYTGKVARRTNKSSTKMSDCTAKWTCVPYFSLESYAGLGTALSKTSCPNVTLLQEKYPGAVRQRDMEQAVCKLGLAPKDHCFHISQLWCVSLANGLLVTCGSMDRADLGGDILTMGRELATSSDSSGRIFVQHGRGTLWTFSASQCLTWFAFISHFTEFWPKYRLIFEHASKPITADDWPKLLKYVKSTGAITLHLKRATADDCALNDTLLPESKGKNTTDVQEREHRRLHVLSQHTSQTGSSTEGDEMGEDICSKMRTVDSFLRANTSLSFAKRSAYKNCPQAVRDELLRYLNEQVKEVEKEKNDMLKKVQDERVCLFNIADTLFQLFLPKEFESATSRKFWGAVLQVVKTPFVSRSKYAAVPYPITELRDALRSVWAKIESFQELCASAPAEDLAKIQMPPQFWKAWLHVVSLLVTYIEPDFVEDEHWSKADEILTAGMAEIIHNFALHPLADSTTTVPLDVTTLICMRLFQDRVGQSNDVLNTYSQYLGFLETEISSKPPDRAIRRHTDMAKEELELIKTTITKQQLVIAELRNSIKPDEAYFSFLQDADRVRWNRNRYTGAPTGQYYAGAAGEVSAKLLPTTQGGLQEMLLKDCADMLTYREGEVSRHISQAQDLAEKADFNIDINKDRQENAVYAFTIVTIIFLPLSAVSGIFGMNTADVRDMDQAQWLYWAVALPVTFLTILGGLWWMGELNHLFRWVRGQESMRHAPAVQEKSTGSVIIRRSIRSRSRSRSRDRRRRRHSSYSPAVRRRIRSAKESIVSD